MPGRMTPAAMALAVLLVCPATAFAQTEAAADTIADFVQAVENTVARFNVLARIPDSSAVRYRDALERVNRFGPKPRYALRDYVVRSGDPFRTAPSESGWPGADYVYLLAIYGAFEDSVLAATDPEAESIRTAVQRFRSRRTAVSLSNTVRRLEHYELRFGPDAPRLNLAEVALNFWLQRFWIFKSTWKGPSPYEAITGYSTSYATRVEGDTRLISAFEFGVRRYNFSHESGRKSGIGSYFVPRYLSIGLAVGADADGALQWPFEKQPRLGPFISFGELKAAYLGGDSDEWRVIVSRQFQLLPHVF